MPSSINMPLTENEKRSMKDHIDKYLAVSSKVVVQNKKKTIWKMSERFVKVKVSNYLSTLVQKRTAYRGTHVGAFNLEFWSQIKEVFSSEETLWGIKPLTTRTRAGFEPTLLPSRRFTVINRKPYMLTTWPRRKWCAAYNHSMAHLAYVELAHCV